MNKVAIPTLPKPVAVKVRVDGSAIAIINTQTIGLSGASLPVDELPLTENSFVELEFLDGQDRLIVPARVSAVGETELSLEYELIDEAFRHWYQRQSAQI